VNSSGIYMGVLLLGAVVPVLASRGVARWVFAAVAVLSWVSLGVIYALANSNIDGAWGYAFLLLPLAVFDAALAAGGFGILAWRLGGKPQPPARVALAIGVAAIVVLGLALVPPALDARDQNAVLTVGRAAVANAREDLPLQSRDQLERGVVDAVGKAIGVGQMSPNAYDAPAYSGLEPLIHPAVLQNARTYAAGGDPNSPGMSELFADDFKTAMWMGLQNAQAGQLDAKWTGPIPLLSSDLEFAREMLHYNAGIQMEPYKQLLGEPIFGDAKYYQLHVYGSTTRGRAELVRLDAVNDAGKWYLVWTEPVPR
jgi:hypothetical protein